MSRFVVLGGIATLMLALGIFWYLESASDSAAEILTLCESDPNKAYKELCYANAITKKVNEEGIPEAFALIEALYAADEIFLNSCHGNVHELGKVAYDLYSQTGEVKLTTKVSYCGFGFFHGFIEEMIVQEGNLSGAKDFCRYVGRELGSEQTYVEGACYHGIGHGVTDGSDPRVWGDAYAMATPGIEVCRQVAEPGEWYRRCVSGVFNSIVLLHFEPQYKLDNRDDPYALCAEEYIHDEKIACYAQMNVLARAASKNDIRKLLSFAQHVPDQQYREGAIENAAAAIYGKQPHPTQQEILVACQELAVPYVEPCVLGAVSGIIEFGSPGKEHEEAIEFCTNDLLLFEERKLCVKQIVRLATGVYSAEKQRLVCESISSDIRPENCLKITWKEN